MMRTVFRWFLVSVGLGCLGLTHACLPTSSSGENAPRVVSGEDDTAGTNGEDASEDTGEAVSDTGPSMDGSSRDGGDTGVDTGEQVDTYTPEPRKVEGPTDRAEHTCQTICADEGLECSDRCENKEGKQVWGMATYITNVSGETYDLPEPIESCSETIEYSKSRQIRKSFWCCCQ